MGASSQGTFKIVFKEKLPAANYSQMIGIIILNQRWAMSKISILKKVSSLVLRALIKLKQKWVVQFIHKIQIKTI